MRTTNDRDRVGVAAICIEESAYPMKSIKKPGPRSGSHSLHQYGIQSPVTALRVGTTFASHDQVTLLGSSPHRVGGFGLISYRVEHAGEDFQAQVLLVT